jgi:cytochrome c553
VQLERLLHLGQPALDLAEGKLDGAGAQLMKDAVAGLNIEDMISIAAYMASLSPQKGQPGTPAAAPSATGSTGCNAERTP